MKNAAGIRCLATAVDSAVTWRNSGSVTVLTLNRPTALNPLTEGICLDIKNKLLDFRKSLDVSCFIVKGNGKAFCAGGDVKELWRALSSTSEAERGSGKVGTVDGDFFREEYEMNYLLATSKVPQVSLWNGIVMGGGVGLSVYGDFRVATERTVFAMPECSIGIFPDVGSSSWLPSLEVRGLGLYLGLTGCKLGASDLLHTGLATHFVSSDRLLDLENELISSCPDSREADGSRTEAREVVGSILDRYHETNTSPPDEMRSVVKPHSEAIERCFAGKMSVDSILSALEAELAEPSDSSSTEQSQKHDWIRSTVTTINKQPPTSLMLTLTLLALAEERLKLDLKRCLEAEYRAMMHCMRGPNFREGVRALLIDKDGAPMWMPSTQSGVTNACIKSHFDHLGQFDLNLKQYD